jgi:hypothetical protein
MAFLNPATPVPEPAASLTAIAIGVAGFRARRRFRLSA